MTINRHNVQSYEELLETIEKLTLENLPIYILFINQTDVEEEENKEELANKDCLTIDEIKKVLLDANDGIDVECVIDDYLNFIPESRTLNYILCYLHREEWGPGTPICADPNFYLIRVPTLIRLKGPQRLEMGEISRFPLLALLFEEDEIVKEEEELNENGPAEGAS